MFSSIDSRICFRFRWLGNCLGLKQTWFKTGVLATINRLIAFKLQHTIATAYYPLSMGLKPTNSLALRRLDTNATVRRFIRETLFEAGWVARCQGLGRCPWRCLLSPWNLLISVVWGIISIMLIADDLSWKIVEVTVVAASIWVPHRVSSSHSIQDCPGWSMKLFRFL